MWDLVFGVWGLGFKLQGLGFRVWDEGFRVQSSGLGFRIRAIQSFRFGIGPSRNSALVKYAGR